MERNDIDILNKIKKAGDLLRVCAVGGNSNNGTNCGLGYVNTNNVPSNRNVNYGSRLYIQGIRIKRHYNIKQVAALPLGKKQHLSNGVSNLLAYIGKILFVYPISESPNSLKA
ncbi:MAG: hypothetical protein IJ681_08035 [Bacteroidales bacterium]|nr:hypothetical protein [Bacteroidales bacterium]